MCRRILQLPSRRQWSMCWLRTPCMQCKEFGIKKFAIAGGVASNGALRECMREACRKRGVAFYHPSPILCTDNAAMIGAAAYYEYWPGHGMGWI